jgi:hypothetical protein
MKRYQVVLAGRPRRCRVGIFRFVFGPYVRESVALRRAEALRRDFPGKIVEVERESKPEEWSTRVR